MRFAKPQDIFQLHQIYSHHSVSPNMGFDPCNQTEFEEVFAELNSGGELIIEERGAEIVAVCKVIRHRRRLRHSAYVGSLAVKNTMQGKGIGRKFFTEVIEMLQREGFSRIELLVAADNVKAFRFFQNFGFQIEGTHKNYFSRAGSDQLFTEYSMAWVRCT